VAHEKVELKLRNKELKACGSMKMEKFELYLKGATVITPSPTKMLTTGILPYLRRLIAPGGT